MIHRIVAQLPAADADVERPSEAVQETLAVSRQLAVGFHEPNVQDVEPDAVVVHQVAKARQKERVVILPGKLAAAVEDHAAGR